MYGENLKILRKAKGLSQEELTQRLHIVRQTVAAFWAKVELESLYHSKFACRPLICSFVTESVCICFKTRLSR